MPRTFKVNIGSVKMLYPHGIARRPKNLGVLETYKNKEFTEKEINEVIAELIVKVPYISGAMNIDISIITSYGEYHHLITFKNYEYESQEIDKKNEEIKFKY